MQIYEVFGPAANTRAAQQAQRKYAASAARSAEKLSAAGYGQPAVSTPASQLIAQVRNDRSVQQLVNTWTAQWPKLAANIPETPPDVQPPAPPTPAVSTEPLAFGGQRLDPNDPTSAKIIALAKAQGKINEQQAPADTAAYRAAFVTWADEVVDRTTRQSGAVARQRQQADWADMFKKAADQVTQTANDPTANRRAVQEYLTLAVAAARAANQEQPASASRAGTGAGLTDPQAKGLARAVGLDASDLTKLNQYMQRNNERINPQGTGSESLDALLRAAKILR